jgi:protein-disulfide isomerase
MASRAKAKEEARQRRIAEEQARAAAQQRVRRLQMLTGVVLLAVVVIGVAIAVSSGNSTNSLGLQKGKQLASTEAAVSQMFQGIPQSGNTLGSSSAPVTLTYYGDLECPICRDFTLTGGFPQLVQNEVRQGKVKIVYSATCTATCNSHPRSTFTSQQIAALAAGQQNKFWNYAELFYRQQADETSDYVNEHYLSQLAIQAGLNVASWQAARSSQALSQELTQQEQSETQQGINSTPTLIFSGPKGKNQPPESVPSYANLQSSIQAVS